MKTLQLDSKDPISKLQPINWYYRRFWDVLRAFNHRLKNSPVFNVSFFKTRIKRRDEIFARIAPASVACKALARGYCLTAHAFCDLRKQVLLQFIYLRNVPLLALKISTLDQAQNTALLQKEIKTKKWP